MADDAARGKRAEHLLSMTEEGKKTAGEEEANDATHCNPTTFSSGPAQTSLYAVGSYEEGFSIIMNWRPCAHRTTSDKGGRSDTSTINRRRDKRRGNCEFTLEFGLIDGNVVLSVLDLGLGLGETDDADGRVGENDAEEKRGCQGVSEGRRGGKRGEIRRTTEETNVGMFSYDRWMSLNFSPPNSRSETRRPAARATGVRRILPEAREPNRRGSRKDQLVRCNEKGPQERGGGTEPVISPTAKTPLTFVSS